MATVAPTRSGTVAVAVWPRSSVSRTRYGPGPAPPAATPANAGATRSRWPGAHSGHRSDTVTRTVPFGPVTSSTVPQAAEPPHSAGPRAAYRPVPAASG